MTHKPTILIVDDEERNIKLLESMLEPMGYKTLRAYTGAEALTIACNSDVDLILMDIIMPVMDGFEATRKLKNMEKSNIIPIVIVTSLEAVEERVKALEAGADDFLTKPVDKTELRARVKSLLKVKIFNDYMIHHQEMLSEQVTEKTAELRIALYAIQEASLDTIHRLSRAAEYRDVETGSHIVRMSHYTSAISSALCMTNDFTENLLYAAPMHDVGKIGIPDSILLKPGILNAAEWEIMRQHTKIGGQILEGSESAFIQMGYSIALTHHERWDGTGYPFGLKEENIPIEGRITAVADVFDALTSYRPYKRSIDVDISINIIKEGRGSQFDPAVVDAFLSIEDKIRSINYNLGFK